MQPNRTPPLHILPIHILPAHTRSNHTLRTHILPARTPPLHTLRSHIPPIHMRNPRIHILPAHTPLTHILPVIPHRLHLCNRQCMRPLHPCPQPSLPGSHTPRHKNLLYYNQCAPLPFFCLCYEILMSYPYSFSFSPTPSGCYLLLQTCTVLTDGTSILC